MWRRAFLAVVLGLGLAACGGTAGDVADETPPEVTTEITAVETTAAADTTAAGGETIEVTASDYFFQGIPPAVAPGTSFTLTNQSEGEVHEMVLFRIDDEETRSVQELLELPEEETDEVVEFQGVLVALPGEQGVEVEQGGDTVTVSEPGRYAVLCFIPEGADPAAVEEAIASGAEEPPDLGDGTPHALLGMAAEFQAEE